MSQIQMMPLAKFILMNRVITFLARLEAKITSLFGKLYRDRLRSNLVKSL